MATTDTYEELSCKLNDDELARKSREMSQEVLRHQQVELAKSLATQRYGKELKESDRKIRDLAEQVRTGTEVREVRVIERRDYVVGRVHIVRTDTNEIVRSRDMEAKERQGELSLTMPERVATAEAARQLALGGTGTVVKTGFGDGPKAVFVNGELVGVENAPEKPAAVEAQAGAKPEPDKGPGDDDYPDDDEEEDDDDEDGKGVTTEH